MAGEQPTFAGAGMEAQSAARERESERVPVYGQE